MVCPGCATNTDVVRIPRKGFQKFFSLLGLFPFYCQNCGRKFYGRSRQP
ncbi:hypothetical protein BH10ACI4_BH10ACI4_12840 [soil metagenome]